MTRVDPLSLCQIFIEAIDLEASALFYTKIFGWKTSPAELKDVVILELPENIPFGIALVHRKSEPGLPTSGLKIVFSVKDPKIIINLYQSCYGRTANQTWHPGYGRMWEIIDPNGIGWGLFKNDERL